jgi:hypothetical protein
MKLKLAERFQEPESRKLEDFICINRKQKKLVQGKRKFKDDIFR